MQPMILSVDQATNLYNLFWSSCCWYGYGS